MIFLGIRLPILFYDVPLLNVQLKWMLIGERLAQGFELYAEVWDNISPLAAIVYWLLHEVFGKSPLAHQICASLLVYGQAILLNETLIKRQVYLERSLVPAFIYIILSSFFIDTYILSPVLMANTFLIVVMGYVFIQISEKDRSKYRQGMIFEIGAYIGIASLFYFPSILLLLLPIISFMWFTNIAFRQYLLMVFASAFTLIIAFLFFYLNDTEYDFFIQHFQSIFYLKPRLLLPISDLLLLLALPLLFTFFMIIVSSNYRRYSNYQNRCENIGIFWLIIAGVSVLLSSEISYFHFMLIIPSLSFLLGHYFLNITSFWLRELAFASILLAAIFFSYGTVLNIPLKIEVPGLSKFRLHIDTQDLIAQALPEANYLQNRKVLVCGETLGAYLNAQAATPYLNWRLSGRHFEQMNQYYEIKTSIYENFRKDYPEVIVDEDGSLEKIFASMPLLAGRYQRLEDSKVYLLREK